MISSITKLFLIAGCLATTISLKSTSTEALLLGNFIGCNTFACRLSALETDVAQLKQQVARLDPNGGLQGINNFQRPNNMRPFNQNGMNNPNMNNQQNGQQGNNQQQQGNNPQQQGGGANSPNVNYALDYPMNNQNMRRNPNFSNSGQFF